MRYIVVACPHCGGAVGSQGRVRHQRCTRCGRGFEPRRRQPLAVAGSPVALAAAVARVAASAAPADELDPLPVKDLRVGTVSGRRRSRIVEAAVLGAVAGRVATSALEAAMAREGIDRHEWEAAVERLLATDALYRPDHDHIASVDPPRPRAPAG